MGIQKTVNRLACQRLAVVLALSVATAMGGTAWAATGSKLTGKAAVETKKGAQSVRSASSKIQSKVKPKIKSKRVSAATKVVRASSSVQRLSYGTLAGLQATSDPLDLRSNVALVVDQDTREVLFRKNDSAVLPIASLTKLMTGLLVSEGKLPLDESITITTDDVDTEKGSSSRLRVGTTLTRGELLQLALMSSENRAAHALGRTYPGGMDIFVGLMNSRARALGMVNTRYVEPTGLSSRNQSSAQDLALLVSYASRDPLISELSTAKGYTPLVGKRLLQFNNTNALVKDPDWDIGVQKTGYISEAGRCLVMQAKIAGRKVIMIFLDSAGRLSRVADAQRVKRWVETNATINPFQTSGLNTVGRG